MMPDLIQIVDRDPMRVLSLAEGNGAKRGVRGNFDDGRPLRWEAFGEMAQAAAAGNFTIPIARTFPLEQWRDAVALSLGGNAGGKLLLLMEAS
ncbi:MAG TPA: zinc-binding dehydrogenase [Kofleriaceae bacterium]|jgi:NADPH:quinone reductase-like Zn-dependent oxidoreductase